MAAKPTLEPRKKPRQARSRQTVDAILEGATRVFAERGIAGGTTNHIAERAGVSVGTLYEYFPNKDAILVELVDRQMRERIAEVEDHLRTAVGSDESLSDFLRRFVLAMLEVHEREPEFYRVVLAEDPHVPELNACVLRMEESLAHTLKEVLEGYENLPIDDPDISAHLLFQITEALTHRYAHQGIHGLPRDRFVAEVVHLLGGYLGVR